MADQRRGTFVQLSSLGGLIALPHNSAYAAAKFGVEGYLESLRAELAPLGISVVLVEPGQVNTETLATTLLNARERRFAELLATVTGREESAYEHALTEGARAALTPEAVAREIARTLADPRPPLRNPIGRQARWIWFAKRILGYAGMERILTGMT
jgi:short-subunit dehydrogenase